MSHTIKVTLTKDGRILTEVQGIKGPSCKEATEWLSSLGITVDHGPTAENNEMSVEFKIETGF